MSRDSVVDVLREYDALHQADPDADLEAVRTAILVEDVFGVTLSDAEIDPALLSGPAAVAAVVDRLRGSV